MVLGGRLAGDHDRRIHARRAVDHRQDLVDRDTFRKTVRHVLNRIHCFFDCCLHGLTSRQSVVKTNKRREISQ